MNDMWNNPNPNAPNFMNYRLPKYEVIKVNGEGGARSIKMAPNSSVILADETAPMIWFAQTDGAGYLTVTPYDITPHKVAPSIDVNDLAQRVTQLEELINAKSNSQPTGKQPKRQQPNANANANTTI